MKQKLKYPSKTYFTADTHFGHASILKHCQRPFSSVEEMDEVLKNNWNALVKPGSTVYILGDFAFNNHAHYLNKLNGKKVLIEGNHDKMSLEVKALFSDYHTLLRRNFFKHDVTLCHYAMRTWASSIHGSWQLYGHSHGRIPETQGLKQIDVGVDVWNYQPVPFEVIKAVMDTKSDKPIYVNSKNEDPNSVATNAIEHLKIWQQYDQTLP